MAHDTEARTAGELVKAKELLPKDIEALFGSKTTLPLRDGYPSRTNVLRLMSPWRPGQVSSARA